MADGNKGGAVVVDGIKVNIAPEDTEDALLIDLMMDAEDESLSEQERGRAAWQANQRLFGRAEWKRILAELAERRGVEKADGSVRLPPEAVREFIDKATEAVNRKNSDG